MPPEVKITALRVAQSGQSKRGTRNLTKTIAQNADGSWREVKSYDRAKWFLAQHYKVNNSDELLELIKRVAAFPDACLIRGRLKVGDSTTKPVRRLFHDDGAYKAAFEGAASAFIPIDVDTLPFPDSLTTETDIKEIVAYVRSKLPSWLREVRLVWQKTSSYGVVDKGIRLRLYALTDTPVDADELKELFSTCIGIDPSVFYPVQPIYVAAPIVESGEDFIAERLGISEGRLDRAPIGAALAALRQERKRATKVGIRSGLSFAPSIGFDGYVAQIGDDPHVPGGKGFFKPLKSAVAAAFARQGSQLDQQALIKSLAAIVRERGALSGRPESYIKTRLRDLQRLVTNIGRRQLKQEKAAAEAVYVSDEEAGIVRPTKTADEVAAELPGVFANFFEMVEPVAVDRIIHAAREKGVELAGPDFIDVGPLSAPQQLALVDLGVGKSEAAFDAAIAYVSGERLKGVSRRIGFVVNDHKLAEDVAARFNKKKPGVAAVWYGMEQIDPLDSEGRQMCRRLADVGVWRTAGGSTRDFCAACPFGRASAEQCGYTRQRPDAPIIILVGPSTLMNGVPAVLKRRHRFEREDGEKVNVSLPPFDAVIVDETRAPSWVGGFGKPFVIGLDEVSGRLRPPSVELTGAAHWTKIEWQDLDDRFETVRRLVEQPVKRLDHNQQRTRTFGEMRRVFSAVEGWQRFRKDLYRLLMKVDTNLAGLSGEVLKTEVSGFASWNSRVRKLIRLCSVAIQSLTVRLPDSSIPADSDACVRFIAGNGCKFGTGIRLTWRDDFDELWVGVPTLVLDATADVELLRLWWTNLKVVAEGRAKLPDSVTVYQVHDTLAGYRGWSPKRSDGPLSPTAEADLKRALNNTTRVQHSLEVLSVLAAGIGGVGFVGPKALVEELERRWAERPAGRPAGVIVGHYGAVRGRDDFGKVAVLMDISRLTPPPGEVEDIAEALLGLPVQRLQPGEWFEQGQRFYTMRRDGGRMAPKSESHPDAFVERVRRQIVDAELDQADGRSRALRRDASRPLLQIRSTAQPSDRLQVDELVTMDDVLPFDEFDVAAARGVIVPRGLSNKGSNHLLAAVVNGVRAEAGGEIEPLSADAARKLIDDREQKVRSLGETPKGYIYWGFLRVSDLEAALSNDRTNWRLKLHPAARYWTEVRLMVPCGASEDEARAVLAAVGVKPAFLEPIENPAATAAASEVAVAPCAVHDEAPTAPAGPSGPTTTLSEILDFSNSRVKFKRFVRRPEGMAIIQRALSAGMARDAACLKALTVLIGPERVHKAANAAFRRRRR
ncbi:hypothetical protein KIH24_05675 [Rhizobiales bacterium TNE-4]|nr:hypothetical protein [Rhizobiales bacterium TNE-4]MBV1827112.1 hypothetical protein [Rhizobiales bacterium TNE-4]